MTKTYKTVPFLKHWINFTIYRLEYYGKTDFKFYEFKVSIFVKLDRL